MIRKLFVFILLVSASCVLANAQTPESKKEKQRENAPKVFAWSFDGDGGYLGVQTEEVTKENFGKYGLRDVRGVGVEKVLDKSPAQAAGLQSGDVIVRFNGEEITSVRKLTRLISEIAPDHQAKVAVLRDGSERDLMVTLANRPGPAFENGNFEWHTPIPMGEIPDLKSLPQIPEIPSLPKGEMPQFRVAPGVDGDMFVWRAGSSRQIGVSVSPLTKQLGDYFGIADGNGLLITTVRENSPAAKAGLKAGDVIVEVEGKAVKGDFDLIRAIGEKKEGDIELTIVRDRNRQTLRLTPETVKGNLGPVFEKFEGQTPPAPMKMKIAEPAIAPGVFTTPAPMTLFSPAHRVL